MSDIIAQTDFNGQNSAVNSAANEYVHKSELDSELEYSAVAIIVTNGFTEYLSKAVDSVVNQSTAPKQIYLIDTSDGSNDLERVVDVANQDIARDKIPTSIILYRQQLNSRPKKQTTFADAVSSLLRSDYFAQNAAYIWLLHDDVVVSRSTLKSLLDAATTSETVGVVGSKQVDSETGTLINVGYTSTQTGKRMPLIGNEQVDQGQYAQIDDVMAVSLNGALLKLSVFQALGGINSDLSLYNDSLDFCRRVHLHARRVVVAKDASVTHARRSFEPDKYFALQKSQIIYRIGACPLWGLLFAWFFFFATAFIPSVRQVYSGKKGALKIFFGTYAGLFSLGKIFKTRRLNAVAKVRARRHLKKLYATRHDIALIRRDERKVDAAKLWQDHQPTLLQTGIIKELAKKRRVAFAILLLILVGLTVLRFANSFALLFTGGHFIATDLPASSSSAIDAINAATSGYSNVGFGVNAPVNPVVLPVALISFLTLSVQNALNLLILLSVVLAGLTAWVANSVLTRNNTARLIFAVAWTLLPSFTWALNDGAVATIIAHVLLPLVLYFAARGVGRAATDLDIGIPPLRYSFAALGIVSAFIVSATPCLAAIIVSGCIVAGFFNRRFWFSLIPVFLLNIWWMLWVVFNLAHGSLRLLFGYLPFEINTGSDISALISLICLGLTSIIALQVRQRFLFTKRSIPYYAVAGVLLVLLLASQIISANHSSLRVASDFTVPAVGEKIATGAGKPHILSLKLHQGDEVTYSIIKSRSQDFVDLSDAARFYQSSSAIGEKDATLRDTVGHMLAAPDPEAVDNLALLGIGAIYVEAIDDEFNVQDESNLQGKRQQTKASHDELITAIDSTPNTVRVIEGDERALWRFDFEMVCKKPTGMSDGEISSDDKSDTETHATESDDADCKQLISTWDSSEYEAALNSPVRMFEVFSAFICLLVFIILALPIRKRRVIKYDL